MVGVFQFGSDASGEIIFHDDVIVIAINDDVEGQHNYTISAGYDNSGNPTLRVLETSHYVSSANELLDD